MTDEVRRSAAGGPPRTGAWRRALAWLRAIEEAADISDDELRDRRIAALEQEVARLRTIVASLPTVPGATSGIKDEPARPARRHAAIQVSS